MEGAPDADEDWELEHENQQHRQRIDVVSLVEHHLLLRKTLLLRFIGVRVRVFGLQLGDLRLEGLRPLLVERALQGYELNDSPDDEGNENDRNDLPDAGEGRFDADRDLSV